MEYIVTLGARRQLHLEGNWGDLFENLDRSNKTVAKLGAGLLTEGEGLSSNLHLVADAEGYRKTRSVGVRCLSSMGFSDDRSGKLVELLKPRDVLLQVTWCR